jgi:hypothetical protein
VLGVLEALVLLVVLMVAVPLSQPHVRLLVVVEELEVGLRLFGFHLMVAQVVAVMAM